MATVAELRMDVDSRSVKTAEKDLDRLEGQAEKTERAAEDMGRAVDKSGRHVSDLGNKANRSGRRVGGLEKAVGALAVRAGALAAGLAAAGVALAGAFGGKSLKAFAQFESGFSKIETLLDDTSFAAGRLEDNVSSLSSGILKLRADSGDSFDNLNKGLFDLVSAGVSASDSLRVLTDANTLAKAGATDVAVSVDGLTTAINAYGIEAQKSEIIAAKFFTTQKFGKTTVEDLSRGLGQVAPLAAQLGVTLDELFASQAAATSAGIRQSEAYTGLKAALTNIVKPAKDAADEAERLGVQFDAAALKSKGLTQFLKDIEDSANFTDESFQKLFGSAEALNFVLAITGGGAETYRKTLRELSDETKSLATLQEAYAKVLNDTDQRVGRLQGTLGAITVAIGAGLAPAFGDLVEKFTNFLRGDDFAARLEGITAAVKSATSVFANAASGVQSLADAFRGLSIVLEKQLQLLSRLSGAKFFEELANIDQLKPAFDAARRSVLEGVENSTNPFNVIIEGLTEIGKRAREAREEIDGLRAANDERLASNISSNEFLGVAPGISSELSGIAGSYDDLTKAVVLYGEEQKAATESTKIANDNFASTQKTIGGVERALRQQLAVAERLAKAAKGGKIAFELEIDAIGLEKAAQAAVGEAKEAGEELSLATAQLILGQTQSLERAAEAMLDAEKRLRDRAAQRSDRIASDLQGKIDAFTKQTRGIDFRNVGDLRKLDAAIGRQVERLAEEIDDASIGLNVEQLEELYQSLEDAGVSWREEVKDAFDYGADRVRQSLEFGLGNALDDLLFNGGRGLGDQFERLLRDAANDNFIDPVAKAFTGNGSVFGNIKSAFSQQLKGFQNALGNTLGSVASSAFSGFQGFKIGGGLSDLLGITGNRKSQQAGGAIGGGVGAGAGFLIGGPLGATIGASIGSALGNIIGGLFSKPSNNTAQAVFRPDTGFIAGRGQDGPASDPNAQARDAILKSITDVTTALSDLIGAGVRNPANTPANEAFLNLAVRQDRKTREQFIELGFQGPNGEPFNRQRFAGTEQGALEAVEAGIRLAIESFGGGEKALLNFAKSASRAGRPIEEIIQVLDVLDGALKSGRDQLAEYAVAAASAGLSSEDIVQGINNLNAVLSLSEKPLSQVAAAIEQFDDALKPAIQSLKEAGQSTKGIERIGRDILRGFGESFIEEARDLNLRLKNQTLANYKSVLDEIAQRQNDALLLLERGAITQGEFDFVQSTGGLQAARFFETLDQDSRDNLADFLGLLGEVSGDIAVARARLEEQFDYLIDNVEETASGFEEAARNFERLGQNLRQTAENIRVQFSGLTPRANVDELLGRVTELRTEGLAGNVSALEALPQVVTSLVESARQAFGGTAEFARIRDFGLSALDDTAGLAERLAKQNFEAAENARADVKLLADIRNLIDDDRQLNTLQGILDSGRLTNQLIAEQLQTFLNLFGQGGRPANEVSIEELQAAAAQAILAQQSGGGSSSANASSTQSSTPASSTPASGQQLTEAQFAQALAEQATATDRNTKEINALRGDFDDLAKEIRRFITQQAA